VKPIRLSDHALRYASKRGFTVDEVVDAIRTTPWQSAELGRLECRKDFGYHQEWNGRIYATKQVRLSSSKKLRCRKRSLRSARSSNGFA